MTIEEVDCLNYKRYLLDKAEWQQESPDFYTKKVFYKGILLMDTQTVCRDCQRAPENDQVVMNYMVKNEVWNQVMPARGFLCLACLAHRLGRNLTIDDFINAPINKPIFTILSLFD